MTETPNNGSTGCTEDTASSLRVHPKSPREAIQPDQAPPPPSRSRHARNPIVIFINFLLSVAVIGVVAAGGLLYWGKTEFDAPGPMTEDKTVVIPSGSGLSVIADTLENQGVIDNAQIFWAGVLAYKNAQKLKAGEYAFTAGSSMRQVMEDLVEGKAVYHTVTVPEGWTSAQIVARVREHPVLTGTLDKIPPEGSLLPETYTFTRGTSRAQIIKQMMEAQKNALASIWERRNKDIPLESPEELVILASIVEKETARSDERTRVAGVFINRLRKSMRLQSDPTILYGLHGGSAWQQDRSAITRSDLDARNPYNTYQIDGLPPGPIGNPGRAAMEAVANPSRTKDLYFVADGTGGHVFAETYEQHRRNVANWRKVEREARRKAAEAAKAEKAKDGDAKEPAANGDVSQ
ncbi:endolytic transglycosylase MltG [Stappia taiwanensis]|uniref:Endolytic murein transglycosylase n=1 Tax=Stappia taiwanensis TaxID=992267 RepID=A0A838XXY0_9HYPH|nr:endolytic transglycosylase MltG [Stappia taiwanensis]MBA4611640.1 endolytic transglycosylase MltG [Stappia taiwanensis]GGE97944.1 aminodeoxychorismate lyase [Stappia taiwanensis]